MSDFSPDLRLELIDTGDQAGVWGETTNTNLGTLLESAVAGYTAVPISATPQALTANDGAPDEARFAAIAFTGAAADFTVCIPPNSKLYTFYNATSYTATISNATADNGTTLTGGTTVAIPANKTMSVWSDGSNVAQQNNHFVGTPTAPTAAAKDATTQIATDAFVDRLRSFLTSTTTTTAVVTDRGCLLPLTASITIPNSVFAANDAFTIFNNSSSSISVTQGSGVTMYWAGPATTGTRTLAGRGLCTVIFISASVCVISGAGLS